MYKEHELFSRINTAINWNGISYTIYKITSTALTFVLYRTLSTEQFALWAGINSMIYLILLWADCGMRKAIPRFCPMLQPTQRTQFIKLLLWVHIGIATIACPVVFFMIKRYMAALHIPLSYSLLAVALVIFITQSIEGLLKLIFHAHLWHRTYNRLSIFIMTLYTLLAFIIVMLAPANHVVLILFIGTAAASILYTLIGFWLLHSRLSDNTATQGRLEKPFLQKFAIHSSVMWGALVAKSLSERNVTVPFVTFILGPAAGNFFKVAQDGALLLQRMVLKTIGTTDTSLLAYSKQIHSAGQQTGNPMNAAFHQLATKIARLCVPLVGIVWFIGCQAYTQPHTPDGFSLFLLMSICLLLELLFMPYERMLEVDAQYTKLFAIYVPYLIALALIGTLGWLHLLTLTTFVVSIYGIRLLSLCGMMLLASRTYKISYPAASIAPLFAASLLIGSLCHLLVFYTTRPTTYFFSFFG